MATQCFWLEPTDQQALYLRRYVQHGEGSGCEASGLGTHNAKVRIEDAPIRRDEHGKPVSIGPEEFKADPRWPATCPCGYVFTDSDVRQVFPDHLYRRADTGELVPLIEAPAGAIWNAEWMADVWRGEDGRCLVVRLPNGSDWMIDGPASNCTIKDDHEQRTHHCWTRSGEPPLITVGKKYGPTCKAGAGSIKAGNYHGQLIDGMLVDA